MPRGEQPTSAGDTAGFVQALGYLALVPPAALLVIALFEARFVDMALRMLLIYAATILAFLGGAQWAAALPDAEGDPVEGASKQLLIGIAAPLWAAFSLLLPASLSAGALLIGLVALLAYELLGREHTGRGWYLRLRLRLTAALGAVLMVFLVL